MSAPTSELGRDKDVSDGSASALVDADVLLPGGDKECPAGDGALCWVASCAVKRMPHSLHGDPEEGKSAPQAPGTSLTANI